MFLHVWHLFLIFMYKFSKIFFEHTQIDCYGLFSQYCIFRMLQLEYVSHTCLKSFLIYLYSKFRSWRSKPSRFAKAWVIQNSSLSIPTTASPLSDGTMSKHFSLLIRLIAFMSSKLFAYWIELTAVITRFLISVASQTS